jgi:hypothetical protein|tara:strand:+ start:482 stop:805 length:324 start_codon:yes stop_codon:yes gene_type:complete
MKYTDYIAQEVKQNLVKCSENAQLDHHFYTTPLEPIIGDVGKVNYGESNYAVGPLTKTIFVSDVFGNRYKVSIEDLKKVKGKGFITHAEADKLDLGYDREEGIHYVK